jgi:quercetin dioxygenase-like cupin family protein
MTARAVFTSPAKLRTKEIAKGVLIRPLAGEHVMLSYAELGPGTEVATHSHPHEQGGIVLEGEVEFWAGDERHVIRRGDMFMIPGGVPHGSRATRRAVLLEAFYPLREEYLR